MGSSPSFEPLKVFLVFFRSDQFVVAVLHEFEQVFQKLAHAGGADKILQVQFTKATAQVNPKVLFVEHAELHAIFLEKSVAIFVKGRDPQAGQVGAAQLFLDPLAHLLGRILGVGDGENFVGPGMAFANQPGDAFGEDSGLPRTCAGDHQHGPVDVFDRFPLALVRFERSDVGGPGFGGPETRDRFCDSH